MKRKMMSKIVAVVVALCMVFTSGAVGFADTSEVNENKIIDSGKCGEMVTWELAEDGTLTFSGTGEMDYFSCANDIPWSKHREVVGAVIIEEGITSIADYSFENFTLLSNVIMPNSLKNIGFRAFFACENINSILIPDNVDEIGSSAFSYCLNLEEIVFPEYVEYGIGSYAFNGCTSLKSVTIPNGIKNIVDNMFSECTSLSNVIIPESVTSISSRAFWGCTSLGSIKLHSNISKFGDEAFLYCNENLVFVCDNNVIAEQYAKDNNITYVTYSEHPEGAHVYGDWQVKKSATCDSAGLIQKICTCGEVIVEETEPIKFNYDSETKTMVISGYGEVRYDNSFNIPNVEHSNETETLVIEEGITAIVHLYGFGSLKELKFPSGLKTIEGACFQDSDIEVLTLPDGLINLHVGAFRNCEYLKRVFFGKCDTQELPNYFTGNPFEGCNNLKEIIVPDDNNVFYVENGALFLNYKASVDENLVTSTDSAHQAMICYPSGLEGDNFNIPYGVETIASTAFDGECVLENVNISESVINVCNGAFSGCPNIKKITFPRSVLQFGNSAASKHPDSDLEIVNLSNAELPLSIYNTNWQTGLSIFWVDSKTGKYVDSIKCGSVKSIEVEAPEKTIFSFERTKYKVVYDSILEAMNSDGEIPVSVMTCKEEKGRLIEYNGWLYEVTEVVDHEWADVSIIQATCTEYGNLGGKVCVYCGEFRGGTELPPIGHSYYNDYENEISTCTEYTVTYRCIHCDDTYQEKYPPKIKHIGINPKIIEKAGFEKDGLKKYTCKYCKKEFTESIPMISSVTISMQKTNYMGSGIKPFITVLTSDGKTITGKCRITIKNSFNNSVKTPKNVGKYTYTIKFTGDYTGSVKRIFKIIPAATSIDSVKASNNSFTVKWDKRTEQVTGYQVRYSTSSKFNSSTTKTITNNKTVSKTYKGLKDKKTYYVKVRTYKTVNGTKYYSDWSKVKSIKTK